MLLLTDDLEQGAQLKKTFETVQLCSMLKLDEACGRPPVHSLIACRVELADPVARKQLGAALSHHRSDPRSPLLLLVRDTAADLPHARALGATHILPRDSRPEQLQHALRQLASRAPAKADIQKATAASLRAQREVERIGGSFQHLFKSASLRRPIALATLERGASDLMASVKSTRLTEWLEIVRRYDNATYQHCLLVAGLVTSFAHRLGLALPTQHLLSQAALVHDIGKAQMPLAVINKPSALTDAEQALLRTHAAAGYEMLARQEGVHPTILDVVRHHHELLDGSGYPDGLVRGQISDLVRIVTICDIYAALIERRPYKAPMPCEEAFAVLVAMGGKLDAGLLEAFRAVVRES